MVRVSSFYCMLIGLLKNQLICMFLPFLSTDVTVFIRNCSQHITDENDADNDDETPFGQVVDRTVRYDL